MKYKLLNDIINYIESNIIKQLIFINNFKMKEYLRNMGQ